MADTPTTPSFASGAAGLGAGAALGGAGAYLTAQGTVAQAAAANKVLQQNIADQEGFYNQNAASFANNMATYDPTNQATGLADAQAARGAADSSAISAPSAPLSFASDAPPAVMADYEKRMGAEQGFAQQHAQALGDLGGYTDQQESDQLANNAATNAIDLTNNESAGRAALLAPEQQLAQVGQGSVWGPILSGLGSLTSSAAGSGALGSAASAAAPYLASAGSAIGTGASSIGSSMLAALPFLAL